MQIWILSVSIASTEALVRALIFLVKNQDASHFRSEKNLTLQYPECVFPPT